MSAEHKSHNKEKAEREIFAISLFLPVLAENDRTFSFLDKYCAELRNNAACREINELQIGRDGILQHNLDSLEDKAVTFNRDFVLIKIDEEFAAERNISVKSVNWPKIYIEATDCVNEAEKEVLGNSAFAAQMPEKFYPMVEPEKNPEAGEVDLVALYSGQSPKKITAADRKAAVKSHIENANMDGANGFTGNSRLKNWAEKIAGNINKKRDKLKTQLDAEAQKWAEKQEENFPQLLEKWRQDNQAWAEEQRKQGLKSVLQNVEPYCPQAREWLGYPERGNGNEFWLLINSSYDVESAYPCCELAPYLIWQAGKNNSGNFMPFNRLIIKTSQGFIIFKWDWIHFEIWKTPMQTQ